MKNQPERFAVALVAGSNPESFVMVSFTSELEIARLDFFSHDELCYALEKDGHTKLEIDAMVRKGENPK